MKAIGDVIEARSAAVLGVSLALATKTTMITMLGLQRSILVTIVTNTQYSCFVVLRQEFIFGSLCQIQLRLQRQSYD